MAFRSKVSRNIMILNLFSANRSDSIAAKGVKAQVRTAGLKTGLFAGTPGNKS